MPSWFAAGACLAAALQAQVSPIPFGVAEGGLSSRSPLAISAPGQTRTMQIHDDVSRSIRPIQAMHFRRDGVDPGVFAPFTVQLSIVMSIGATSAAAPDAVYANNHGANQVTVVATQVMSFPGTQPRATLPAPFEYVVPFDVPFTHSPFSPSGPLVWDMITQSPTSSGELPRFDAASPINAANPPMVEVDYGNGCIATGRSQPMSLVLGNAPNWANGSMGASLGAVFGPSSAPAATLIGFSNTAQFELPGTAGGPSGPCSLLLDLTVSLPVTTNALGTAILPLAFPVDPTMHGDLFFNQVVAIDLAANSLGVVSSDAAVHQFVAPFAGIAVGRVQSLGSVGPTGIVTSGTATMTRFVR